MSEGTTVLIKPRREPAKPWKLEVRALNGVAPPPEIYDKEFDTFDEAVVCARKTIVDLNAMAMEDGVIRRDYYKIAIIEV